MTGQLQSPDQIQHRVALPQRHSKPPAPSTSSSSQRAASARTCLAPRRAWTVPTVARAASSGATGDRNRMGYLVFELPRSWASPEDFDVVPTLRSRTVSWPDAAPAADEGSAVSNAVRSVLPTPVSVPVTKMI